MGGGGEEGSMFADGKVEVAVLKSGDMVGKDNFEEEANDRSDKEEGKGREEEDSGEKWEQVESRCSRSRSRDKCRSRSWGRRT
eukprot:759926-Hanusia_phi.AAC.1